MPEMYAGLLSGEQTDVSIASQKIAVSASKESEWEVNVDAMLPL